MLIDTSWKGLFWRADNSSETFYGILKYVNGEDIILETIAQVNNSMESFMAAIHDHGPGTIFNGVSSDGKLLSLVVAFSLNHNSSGTNIISQDYLIKYILEGIHISDLKEIQILEINFESALLGHWYGKTGYSYQASLKDGAPGSNGPLFELRYNLPSEHVLLATDDRKISIVHKIVVPLQLRYEFNLKEELYLKIVLSSPIDFDVFFREINVMNNFLSLMLNRLSPMLGMQFYHQTSDETPPKRINLFFSSSRKRDTPKLKSYIDNDVISFHDDSIPWNDLLENWFKNYEKYAAALNTYFGALNFPEMTIDQKFMNLISCFESLHREYCKGTYMSAEEYAETVYPRITAAIPADIPSTFRASLKARMQYHYEYSLSKRLQTFLSDHQDLIKGKGDFKNQIGVISMKMKDTRNYYAHRTPELEAKKATSKEIYEFIQLLSRMNRIIMLETLNFEAPLIKRHCT